MTDIDFDKMVDDIFYQGEQETPKFRYKKKPGKMAIPERKFSELEALRNDYYPKYFTRRYAGGPQDTGPHPEYTKDIKIKWCKRCGLSNIETMFIGNDQICHECKIDPIGEEW